MKASILALITVLALFFTLGTGCCRKNDLAREAESIKAADRHYSQLSAEKGMNAAFLAMSDNTAVIIRRNHMPFEGYEQIRELLLKEEDTSFVLTWEPLKAIIAKSCDLGYSYGTYLVKDKHSGLKLGDGTYVTVWKKRGKEW